jgi:hypothetical protein
MARPPAGNGETGVARYINNLKGASGMNETGVAKYIRMVATTDPAKVLTGVERYIRTLPAIESVTPAAKPPTGVQKYINGLPEPKKVLGETGVSKYLKTNGLAV